jgi:dolichol kinase
MVDWQPFIDFCVKYELLFMIWVQVIFGVLGILMIYHAINTRNQPEKKDHPDFFINEMIIGTLLIGLTFIYPFMFNHYVPSPEVRAQLYFHMWDSLTINIILYYNHMFLGQFTKKRLNFNPTYAEFKVQFLKNYKDTLWADIQRKWLHALPPVIAFGLLFVGRKYESFLVANGWTSDLLTIFFIFSVGIHFMVILVESDLMRFHKFHWMSKWSIEWIEHALRPKELDTPTSADIMLLAQMPFIFAPLPVFFATLLITAMSDATASIVGKTASKFGIANKKIGNTNKTFIGLLGGVVMTYGLTIFVHTILPFEGATLLQVHAMGLAAATAFAFIDVFAKRISDNFLNPVICGGLIWLIYLIF